jgi:protein import protein ZIM17
VRNVTSIGRNAPFLYQVPTIRSHSTSGGDNTTTFKVDNPQLMIAFTCKKCDTRSSHTFSKQAYTSGSVLIQCPGCLGRHLIADNLKIFSDNNFNLEEYLKKSGQNLATDTQDLVFEDIPESLRSTIGHYAKNAPEEYKAKEVEDPSLPPAKDSENTKE